MTIEIIQSDRDAAADLAEWLTTAQKAWDEAAVWFAADAPRALREGAFDNHEWVQAFARHRINTSDSWRPITEACKDRSVIWAVFHTDIYPRLEPGRDDLERWNGVQVPLRHMGIVEYDDGPFDMGWNVAAPVGHGGFPDDWIAGWMPIPPPPKEEAQ